MNSFDIVFRKVGVGIITSIPEQGAYKSEIAKKIDVTYPHVVKLIQELESSGHMIVKKHGRIAMVYLTLKGRELKDLLAKCKENLDAEILPALFG